MGVSDWISQYFDFSLYGGGIDNKSTRGIANNSVPGGFENATASYGGWFISPEAIYGYRIPFNAITATPRWRLRYVGGSLDGYSETGSMQNLSVGRRSINDLEEWAEVELSTVSGALKATATAGVIGLERLGNPTINTVLLAQNLSFTTPGQKAAVGGVVGLGVQYRPMPNAKLFVAGEGTAMSDRSDSWAATGGAQVFVLTTTRIASSLALLAMTRGRRTSEATFVVMAGLVPAIHVFFAQRSNPRRGCPAQGRA